MSHSNDDKGSKKRLEEPVPVEAPADKRSGRVSFDSRGNSVWEWQLETGVYSRDLTTQKLKKLDLDHLSIADSGIHPQPSGLGPAKAPGRPAAPAGGGFDPYDTGNRANGFNPQGNSNPPAGGDNPYDKARALGNRLKPDATPSERRRTPADMRKLDQQIKEQRKKLKE